jgi:hypothetical protein
MKLNLKIVYVVMMTLIITACSSNPADDMDAGIQYTYYPDGSCKDRDNNKCVTKEFINEICQSSDDIGVTKFVATSYSVGPAFKALANANGVSTEIIMENNTCFVKLTTGGVYRGTDRMLTRTCQVYQFIKSPSSGKLLISGTELAGCFTRGM